MNSAFRLTWSLGSTALFVCLASISDAPAIAQVIAKPAVKDAPAAIEPKLVVRVYDVADLLVSRNDYPFKPVLPTTMPLDGVSRRSSSARAGGGESLGGMGGMGGGYGGGMFTVSERNTPPEIARQFGGGGPAVAKTSSTSQVASTGNQEPTPADRLLQLVHAVTGADPDPDNSGADQICRIFGNKLIVRHTEEGQVQVAALLTALGSGSASVRSVTVEATWLVLDAKGFPALQAGSPEDKNVQRSKIRVLNAKKLNELTLQGSALHGQIRCLNGQQVHLATGRRRAVVGGATPTVGVGAIGYTFIMKTVNVGAVLQITPSISGNREAFLDLQSVVTQWHQPEQPNQMTIGRAFIGSSEKAPAGPLALDSASVDRVVMGTQEWSTTATVPLGVPVLIGSVTLVDSEKESVPSNGSHSELVLVVEVRAD